MNCLEYGKRESCLFPVFSVLVNSQSNVHSENNGGRYSGNLRFFNRITLEDKLGQHYKPCICAALNSAKVMLAVGAKPEYFSAVWVKNEWCRCLGYDEE